MSQHAGNGFEILTDSAPLPGYLALPARGRGPGVLVLHEAWGLVDDIRDVCDRLARADYVALAPDLFRGAIAETEAEAHERVRALASDAVGPDLDAAVAALLNHHSVDGGRIGVLGFCMGGHLSLVTAARNQRVAAAVDFYGAPLGVPVDIAGIEAAVLGIFAENDEYVGADIVKELRRDFQAADKSATFIVEPGVGHAFMNAARPDRYAAAAAERGWDRLLAFLRAELT
ncbi:MAG: dienelactone hydrolase family protein [Deltaproteobacteria bacterium]|nr:dienelactone hydrolase family protein [Deltaproteobacteria bacterium]MBW2361148.1 dienelactone hydrolase family protein [Deltaproteobacteria bacterium]